jgi:hypothetical protein
MLDTNILYQMIKNNQYIPEPCFFLSILTDKDQLTFILLQQQIIEEITSKTSRFHVIEDILLC